MFLEQHTADIISQCLNTTTVFVYDAFRTDAALNTTTPSAADRRCSDGPTALTVLGVCVAERVRTVCVAAVVAVGLARIRSLILLEARLVGGGTARGEAGDDTPGKNSCYSNTNQ